MKRIDLVVPTRHRLAKLQRMLASVPEVVMAPVPAAGIPIFIDVIFDDDWDGFEKLKTNGVIRKWGSEKHMGSVWCRNLLTPQVPDALLYGVDDIRFLPGSIESAALAMIQHFPDDDGVVGFVQTQPNFHPSGMALMGAKFLARYPGKQPFFPGYFHFASQEVFDAANKLGKFYQCQTAKILHYHPGFQKNQMDFTHKEARAFKERDFQIRKERQLAGKIWGIND